MLNIAVLYMCASEVSSVLSLQTVIILTGGCIFFGDEMPMEKLCGILVAMSGIVWYSLLKLQESGGKVSTTTLPLTGEIHS